MVVAASTVSLIIFIAIVVVLGFLVAGAFGLFGSTASRYTGTGRRAEEIPQAAQRGRPALEAAGFTRATERETAPSGGRSRHCVRIDCGTGTRTPNS
jgi:hypothetical protein